MLFLDMGLGKSIVTLTAILEMQDRLQVYGTLILGPLRVVQSVWRQEAAKWEHTRGLTFSLITGSAEERTRALMRPADIYLMNYDNLTWLWEQIEHRFLRKGKYPPFNFLVADEVSKLKNTRMRQGTKRGNALLRMLPYMPYRTGLTGTPASNGLQDLFGQFLVIDDGERLGTSFTQFRSRYFFQTDWQGYQWSPFESSKDLISQKIGDITLNLSAEDYLDMPEKIINDIWVDLPPKQRRAYDEIEREMLVELESGHQVELLSEASKLNRCLQYANGAMYLEPGEPDWESIHDAKLDALDDIVEESAGQPVLVAYQFQHDAHKIKARFPDAVWLSSKTSEADFNKALTDWNTGNLKMIIGHPACLHPSTQVLTELRGWVRITDVLPSDKVFDGIEYVSHKGCTYSGYKPVIEVFGIKMTPNHKLLIGDNWVEAKDVRDTRESRNAAVFQWETVEYCASEVPALRSGAGNADAACKKGKPGEFKTLPVLYRGNIPSDDKHQDMENLAGYEVAGNRQIGPKLRRSWDRNMQRMGVVSDILRRYVTDLFRRFDNRTNRCEQTLLQGQLHMGHPDGATIQQAYQPLFGISGGDYSFGRIVSEDRAYQDGVDDAPKSWDERGRGSGRCAKFKVWERSESYEKSDVYDLVDCGPRHRFLIRNEVGEMFISHNSMGHGIDRLQQCGHTLVWYGLCWSLDLYDQTNARLWRQGQQHPVIIHRLLTTDTVDMAVKLAIEHKAGDEVSIRRAIDEYKKVKHSVDKV